MYIVNLVLVVYIHPYKSHIYTIIKILAELSIITVLILLLIVTNKLSQMMQESVLNVDDVKYVNSLGWAAAWVLCTFNAFCFLMILLDYVFDYKEYV